VQPANTGERIGFAAEQIGEFFIPGAKLGTVGNVTKAAAHTLVQSGDATAAGASGAITAAVPGARAVQRGVSALREGAEKNVVQALGPTKEWAKDEAAKLAPQMLERGVRGTRKAMFERAKVEAKAAGQRIEQAYQQAAANGAAIPGAVVDGELELAKKALLTTNRSGALIPIEGTQPVLTRLEKLQAFVRSLPDDIPVDQAARIKTTWDRIVSKAGLYGPKAGSSATDDASAWAIRESAGSFRGLLNAATPDIQALNTEYAFWKGLKDVLKATEKRTQAQTGGLIAAGTGSAGVVAGAMTGDSMTDRAQNAFLGGLAGRQFVKLIQSPAWRTTVTAPMKDMLADALASGQTGRVLHAMGKISAALPAQMGGTR
jgi:hypothetical protein